MRSPQDTDHAIMTNEQYIQTHKEDDVRRLALAKHPEGIDLQYCLQADRRLADGKAQVATLGRDGRRGIPPQTLA